MRLITDSSSNNIAAFNGLVIPGLESYFQNDDNDLYSNCFIDSEQFDSDDNAGDEFMETDVEDVVKRFLESIIAENQFFRLPCYSHSIQLVIKDALKSSDYVQTSLEKVSKIAKLSHSSTIVAERLESLRVSIPNANKTRWNSQYDMVNAMVGIPSSDLNDILVQIQRRDLCLKTSDYQALSEFINLLSLFAQATNATQAQNTPSISMVAPSILSIYCDLLVEQTNLKYTSSLCQSLLESLLSRFGGMLEQMLLPIDIAEKKKNKKFYDLFKDPVFLIAPFLDGRFRLSWISTESAPVLEKVQEELSNKIQQLVLEQCILLQMDPTSPQTLDNDCSTPILLSTSQGQSASVSAATSPVTPKRKLLFGNIAQEQKKVRSDPFGHIKDEMCKYLNDNFADPMILIKSGHIYPTLSKLAIKILSIPATSAPVERVFSQSGFLFRQHRASMTRTTLQQLTMLKCNRGLY